MITVRIMPLYLIVHYNNITYIAIVDRFQETFQFIIYHKIYFSVRIWRSVIFRVPSKGLNEISIYLI